MKLFSFFVFLALIALHSPVLWAKDAAEAEAPPPPENSLYHVHFLDATYGLNCNGAPMVNAMNIPDPKAHYAAIAPNNALEAMQKLCDGKPECVLTVSPEALGFDPAPNCKKKLALRYRCYNVDAPHSLNVADKDSIQIRCTPPTMLEH